MFAITVRKKQETQLIWLDGIIQIILQTTLEEELSSVECFQIVGISEGNIPVKVRKKKYQYTNQEDLLHKA